MEDPFFLGDLKLGSNVFCAPLAGCSDFPFRQMINLYRPGLFYCEMVKMDAIVRSDPNTFRLLDYEASMHPIGAQLCGSKPQLAAKSAQMIEELGFDVLDLNCGCPVDKVTKDGSGSGLLKNPEKIGEIVTNMVNAVSIPVTIKIRAGWDSTQINVEEIVQIAEKAGAKAICVHGRTRAQGYKGPANWDYILRAKQTAKKIHVIGNGDIYSAEDAMRMFAYTGADAVLVARGTFGQPWIFEDIMRAQKGLPPKVRTGEDYRVALLRHFEYTIAYEQERRALSAMRRVACWYLKNVKGARPLREAINKCRALGEMRKLFEEFAWDKIEVSVTVEQEEECESLC